MTSIRTLIIVASAHKWPLYHMDIKNAFFNSGLFEVVYMQATFMYRDLIS